MKFELTGLEALYLAATLFGVAFITVFGLLLAALGALHGFYEQRTGLLVLYTGLAVLALGLELSRL